MDAAELILLGGLSAWIALPLFSNLGLRLAAILEPLSVPYARGVALGVLFAGAIAVVARVRLRQRTRPAAKGTADTVSGLAYAGFGLLVGALLSGDWTGLGSLAGAKLAASYPTAASMIGIALTVVTIALLYRRSERSSEEAANSIDHDLWTQRVGLLFNTAALTAGVAFALGVLLLFVNLIVSSWVRTYPWSAIVLGALTAYLVWEFLRDITTRSKPAAATIKELGKGFAIVLLICAVLTLILEINFQGFIQSSTVFESMTPAARFAFFAMPAAFLGALALGLARFTYSGHRVRVFISFHHSREDTARELELALAANGLTVGRLPFRPDYEHDALLQRIQHEIRTCAAMVCLPGAQPSFIENEVLVASTLRKFILFVVGEDDPRLPNTAYYGYPVFRLEQLQRHHFEPIAQLILLVAGNWRASLRHFLDGWVQHFANRTLLLWLVVIFIAGTYVAGAVFAAATADAAEVVRFARTFHGAYLNLLGGWIFLWVWLNAFLIGSVFAMAGQMRARRVLRQDILTGHLTRTVLRQRIGGGKRAKRLLACMREKPPLAEHD